MATSLLKLQELTCNRLDKYIVLNGGAVVYNGFVFKNAEELVCSILAENKLIFIEPPAGPRMIRICYP